MPTAAAYSASSDHELQVEYREADSFIGSYGNVLIGASAGQHSYDGLQASRRVHERLRDTYPNGFSKIVITAGGARMPSAEERARINKLAGDFARSTLAIALVFEGDGLWLSSMRVVTKTMMLAISRDFPQSMFATAPEAVPWLVKQCGSAAEFDQSGLIASIAAIR